MIGGRISLLKTEAFESSSGERMVSFPLTPQAPTMHAIKCMILLFDRFYSPSFLAPLPQLQLKNSAHHSSHPICLTISRGTSSEDGLFFALHLILCANALSPLHTLQTFYNILRQNIHALRLIVSVSARPLFLLPYS